MDNATLLFLALILDALLGEPKWLWDRLPHPAVLIGNAITWADEAFNHGANRRRNGILLTAALVLGGWALGHVIGWFGSLPSLILAAIFLAQRSLVDHVKAVGTALRGSLPEGRTAVAMIVGRDTAQMDEPAVARSAIESAAENLSDGVIAPAFWFLLFGLPGLLIYKAVNTADSMIGYLNETYEDFGWAAAKLDDLLNWIPARLTAALIALAYLVQDRWHIIREDAQLHRSPNAGWPEAAMAQALNIALSGPRSYDGQMQDFPFVNEDGRQTLGPNDIDTSTQALWRAWGLFLAMTALLAIF